MIFEEKRSIFLPFIFLLVYIFCVSNSANAAAIDMSLPQFLRAVAPLTVRHRISEMVGSFYAKRMRLCFRIFVWSTASISIY